jgi:hypothetical protein
MRADRGALQEADRIGQDVYAGVGPAAKRVFLRLAAAAVVAFATAPVSWASETVRGRVANGATKAPVAGAEIVVAGQLVATTNEKGEFELTLENSASVTLTAQAAGFLPRVVDLKGLDLARRLVIALEYAPGYSEQLVVTAPSSPAPEPVQEVEAKTIERAPGAFEDGMQSLKSMPGVVSRDGWSGRLYIRGGRPDQNGVFLDGISIYDPYRLFGLTSVFNPETLDSLALHPGGFDARYGNRLSAVITGENRVGVTDRALTGSASISLTNTNLRAEGKLGLDFPSSWLVSFRRTYFDVVTSEKSVPTFTDLQARILLEPSPRHRMTLTLFGSKEQIDADMDAETFEDVPKSHIEAGDDQQNLAVGLQGRHLFSEHFRLFYVASWTSDQQVSDIFFRDGETSYETRMDQDLDASTSTLRTWVESLVGKHSIDMGGEIAHSQNRVGFHINTEDPRWDIPDALKAFAIHQGYERYGAFVQDTYSLASTLDLKAGVRWDRSTLSDMSVTSPRLALAWRPAKAWQLRAAWGHYYQFPSYESLQGDGYFLDLRGIKEARLHPERAEHYVLAGEHTSERGWKLGVDVYYKRLDDLLASGEEMETVLVLDEHDQAHPYARESLTLLPENARRGYAQGAQLVFTMLERKSRPYWGMLAYTYGQVRSRDDSNWRWEYYDQRHSVLLLGGWKLGRSFELGWKWHFATGFPYTPLTDVLRVVDDVNGDGIYDPAAGDRFTYQREDPDATINTRRLPPYHRLDLRLEYAPRLGVLDWIFYLDIINAYARKNIEGYSYNADYSRRQGDDGLPLIPSVGVKARF